MVKLVKEEIIEQCINWTGIEDNKTCLDRQGCRELGNDVYEQCLSVVYNSIKPLVDDIYTNNSMNREERARVHKLLAELGKLCEVRE